MKSWFRKILRSPPADQADEVADQLIEAGKYLGAKTPREAAEIAMGRPLTDEEWGRCADAWVRRWY
jgi:hypothetical protein